jgi:hypothetical protein
MPRDVHVRIAAALHIATGVFLLLLLAVIGPVLAAFGALGPSHGIDRDLAATVGGVGMLVTGIVAVLSVTEIVGAILLLRGSPVGHGIIVGFSVLSLVNIPIGTVAGIYSLWALLRDPQPAPGAPSPVSAPSSSAGLA